jgi:uncharacterized protein (TIGR02722 family)
MRRMILASVFVAIIAMTACQPQRRVTRIDPNETIDLSGRWNSTDSRLVANEMIKDALNRRWRTEFLAANGGQRPVVIVGMIINRSHEHIPSEMFIMDIERAFINTEQVRVVQAGEKRDELRGERADQHEFASPATIKRWGQELGADFIMQGSINSIVDAYRNRRTVTYQVNLELTNLETNEKVWIGEKKIQKYITN